MFLKGVWRCLLQDVNVMGHATSFFPDAWRASFRCEGTPLSFLRRVVGPWLMGRGEERRMEDDMRLKSVVVKNVGKLDLPCLDKCTDKDHCPCEKLKASIENLPDTSVLEMEWMYVPTKGSVTFWTKLVAPVVITLILIGLCFIKAGCCSVFSEGDDRIKVSIACNGCRVEKSVSSVVEFEKSTNDLTKILVDLKRIGEK